jgi:hypothetical protein
MHLARLGKLIDSHSVREASALAERLRQRMETVVGISQGFKELNKGQTRPIGDFIQDMQRKYDILC